MFVPLCYIKDMMMEIGIWAFIGLVFVTMSAIFFYFLPTFTASIRGNSMVGFIFIGNVVIGWTIAGWFVMLALAMMDDC